MKRLTRVSSLALMLTLGFAAMTASAAMVIKMGFGDLVGNADKIFRGTVMTSEPGTVAMGGSEFPTVVYTVRVDDALKGDFGAGKAGAVIELTMLGNLKSETASGSVQRLASLDINPILEVGGEYVLFTTAPSAAGLSTTVGLGQGLFSIFNNADGRDLATNGLNNHGMFDGPVSYEVLSAAIKAEMD
ncbi:MAG: hypothetical protein HKN58_02060 [Xanthomonadales bacterium]|nr:hypothetical protein [Xanthomonadales bacterium]